MDREIYTAFQHGFNFYAIGTLAAFLFFTMNGLRDLSSEKMEGFLYVALGFFFFLAHLYYVFGATDSLQLREMFSINICWLWLANMLAPAVIGLFGVLGLFNMVANNVGLGLLKIVCGGTLGVLMFVIGTTWALDVRGIVTAFGGLIWFNFEMRTPTA